ncbi:MAG TPA: chlorite dismutase family protein [Thermoplasmata archaeon]|nr:chlorite dismutase family protein [Thermoplasmata archaeon]
MTRPRPPGGSETREPRDFVKYTFLHLHPEWRRLGEPERSRGRTAWLRVLTEPIPGVTVRTYSTVGTKAGVDGLIWMVAEKLEEIQRLHARLWGTPLGGFLDIPYSYLGMARKSVYLGGHAHAGQEGSEARTHPSDLPYLFVYPFIKKREWYAIAFERRRKIMAEHFRIGHRFPGVQIHTGYSFGLDDAEFILAFESDSPGDFLDLVEALRPSEASRYTQLETPIFTCLRVPPERLLELAEGIP